MVYPEEEKTRFVIRLRAGMTIEKELDILTSRQGKKSNIMTTARQISYKRSDWTQKRQEYTLTYKYQLVI